MNLCFCCEFIETDVPDTACARCARILRHPFYGPRLLRGSVNSKIRGTMPPKEAEEEVRKFMVIITDSTPIK